jgi:two-component system OmpR family sensor kinase
MRRDRQMARRLAWEKRRERMEALAPLRRHRRRGLRHTLFFSFGMAILVTMLASGGLSALLWPLYATRPWMRLLTLLAAGCVLWLFSGALAYRLARPLWELSRVVKDFGAGALDRRAHVPRRSPYEVSELAGGFNDMAGRIEALVRGQRELMGAVSHELRTPLARQRVLLALLQEAGSDASLIAKFEREIVDMDALVGELLAEARIAAGALTLRGLDLTDIIRECSERLGVTLAGVTVCTGVNGDPTLISRAITLLLDNACKHGGQSVWVRAEVLGELVRISVDDDGQGFEAADLPKVFAPFTRGRGAVADEKRGVGLGLYLVRRIAEAHGGAAFAENREGGGARVGLTLLRAEATGA